MEQWVKIKQIPKDGYFVSDLGRVKVIKPSGEIIKVGSLNWCGYYVISYAFKKPPLKVHQLVLSNFTDRPTWAECINHKNGIRTDNRLENLEWSTVLLNNKHAINKRTGAAHHKSIPIELVHKIYGLKKSGQRICDISRKLSIDRCLVRGIYRGVHWKYEYKKFFSCLTDT